MFIIEAITISSWFESIFIVQTCLLFIICMSSLFEVEHLKNLIYNAAALLALCLKQSIEIIPDIHEYSLSNNGTFNRFSKFS